MYLAGKESPIECEEAFGEGIAAMDREEFESAAEIFELCLDAGMQSEEIQSCLTQCYLSLTKGSLSRYEDPAAAAWLEKALVLNPDFPMLHIIATHLYRKLKRPAIANRHLKRALELDPDDAEAKALDTDNIFAEDLLDSLQKSG